MAPPIHAVVPVSRTSRVLPPSNSAPILSLEQIFQSPDRKSLIGLVVQLKDLNVLGKAGSGFWIGKDEKQRLFLVLHPSIKTDLKAGDRVDLSGQLLNVPAPEIVEKFWDVKSVELSEITSELIYLRGSSIRIR